MTEATSTLTRADPEGTIHCACPLRCVWNFALPRVSRVGKEMLSLQLISPSRTHRTDMFTFKQMEALYWIVQLGSFEAAARKLNASQSAISKRINELESTFDFPVFDRTSRTARVTDKGSELFEYAKELLDRRDEIVERVSANEILARRIRIGVTELTALTWLPRHAPC